MWHKLIQLNICLIENKRYIYFINKLNLNQMKKSLSIVLMCCFFVLSMSCTRKNSKSSEQQSTPNVNMAAILEVENMPNDFARVGVKSLNSDEKVIFWNRHIINYIKTHHLSESAKNQLLTINKTFNRKEIFDAVDAGDQKVISWIKQANYDMYYKPVLEKKYPAATFDDALTPNGIGSMSSSNKLFHLASNTDPFGLPKCNCYWSAYCQVTSEGTCQDKDGTCTHTGTGCGVSGQSACTGICM